MSQLQMRPGACTRLRRFTNGRRVACVVVRAHQSAADPAPSPATAHPPPHPHGQATPPTLCVSQRIAAARSVETRRSSGNAGDPPLFLDPYAELLARWQEEAAASPAAASAPAADVQQAAELCTALDVIATAHIDRLLLNAVSVSAVNRITQGDYRQVVLLGDAMDTRPYRLPLAPGTAIFLVAPAAAHAAAAAALALDAAADIAAAVATAAEVPVALPPVTEEAATSSSGRDAVETTSTSARGDGPGAPAGPAGRGGRSRSRLRGPRAPPGCLLRRVPLEIQPGGDFSSLPSALEAAGFRPDRLSVWAVQGLSGLRLGQQDVVGLLAEAAHCAAYHSLLVGELPPLPGGQAAAANALAECGLLGAPLAFGTPDTSYDRWRTEWGCGSSSGRDGDGGVGDGGGGGSSSAAVGPAEADQRWLFAAQQIRLSAAQMDTFEAHRAAAEATDEDFFDNFS